MIAICEILEKKAVIVLLPCFYVGILETGFAIPECAVQTKIFKCNVLTRRYAR